MAGPLQLFALVMLVMTWMTAGRPMEPGSSRAQGPILPVARSDIKRNMQGVHETSWKFKVSDESWDKMRRKFFNDPRCEVANPLIKFPTASKTPTTSRTSTTSRINNSDMTMDVCAQLQNNDLGFGIIVSGFSYGHECEVPKLGSQQEGKCWFFGGAKAFQKAVDKRLVLASRKEYSLAAKFVCPPGSQPESGITCHSTPEPVCALIRNGKSCFEPSQDNGISVTGFRVKDPKHPLIANLVSHSLPHPLCRAPKPETSASSPVTYGFCCIQAFGGKGWVWEAECWKNKFPAAPVQTLVDTDTKGDPKRMPLPQMTIRSLPDSPRSTN